MDRILSLNYRRAQRIGSSGEDLVDSRGLGGRAERHIGRSVEREHLNASDVGEGIVHADGSINDKRVDPPSSIKGDRLQGIRQKPCFRQLEAVIPCAGNDVQLSGRGDEVTAVPIATVNGVQTGRHVGTDQ